ncbi:MAG: CZB domain-containing protein, partial [Desulfuromonadales bacterium]
MNWKDLKIGKKLGVGFGMVLVLLAGIVGWSILSNEQLVTKFNQMDEVDALVLTMAEKERDHLAWASAVLVAMADDSAANLKVQKDYHKCALGEWYYGERRREAEALVPQIAGDLNALEVPHARLHESAIAIEKAYANKDIQAAKTVFASQTEPALVEVRATLTRLQDELHKVEEVLGVENAQATAR